MEAEMKITVVVPVYNVEKYIQRCIDSILKQTYNNLQIILIDDGSTDDSGIICDRYMAMDRRVEVYHNALNKGSVAARKIGILHSKGDFIGFVDGDDFIEENMFELLLKDILESNADFVHIGYVQEKGGQSILVCDFEDRVIDLCDLRDKEDTLVNYVLRAEGEKHIGYSLWSKLFKKGLIEKCFMQLPEEQQYGEDFLCLCLCILESRHIKLSRRTLYHYMIREHSLSDGYCSDRCIKEIKLCWCLINVLQRYNTMVYKDLEEGISLFIQRRWLNVIETVKEKEIHIPHFRYKGVDCLRGKKIVIYGAGVVGQDYYMQFCKYTDIEIVAWMDSDWQKYKFEYAVVSDISKIHEIVFDKIVIAVNKEKIAQEIEMMLIKCGQPIEKIIWEKPTDIFG